jgi:hypothetical protein
LIYLYILNPFEAYLSSLFNWYITRKPRQSRVPGDSGLVASFAGEQSAKKKKEGGWRVPPRTTVKVVGHVEGGWSMCFLFFTHKPRQSRVPGDSQSFSIYYWSRG